MTTPRTAAGRDYCGCNILDHDTAGHLPECALIAAIETEAAPASGLREALDPDRLTAIIESRMSQQLAWLGDDGKTVSMLGPEQAGWHLAHLYMTGDVVSGLPALAASPSAAPLDVPEVVA